MRAFIDTHSLTDAVERLTVKQQLQQLGVQTLSRLTVNVTRFVVRSAKEFSLAVATGAESIPEQYKTLLSKSHEIRVIDLDMLVHSLKNGVLVEGYPIVSGQSLSEAVAVTEEKRPKRNAATKRKVKEEAEEEKVKVETLEDEVDLSSKRTKRKTVRKQSKTPSDPAPDLDTADITIKTPSTPPKIVKEIRKGRAVVDSFCPVAIKSHVYEEQNAVYDAMLNQTNISANNNKFYIIQLLKSDGGQEYFVWFRWGRVGVPGQNNLLRFGNNLHGAKSAFKSKFRDKTSNDWENRDQFQHRPGKYDLLERDYGAEDVVEVSNQGNEKSSIVAESKLDTRVQTLIQLIFDINMMRQAMVEIGYDANKMPLGKLTKAHVQKGYQVLKEISEILDNPRSRSSSSLAQLCSRFYTIIPHDFGFRRPPVISTKQELKNKLQMVESLAEIEIAAAIMDKLTDEITNVHPIDSYYITLRNEIRPLLRESPEFRLIKKYVDSTHGHTHSIRVSINDIYAVERAGEHDKYHQTAQKLGNRMLLWHGSRLSNWVGILSQGLRIAPPEAPVTGYMFGKGVYFADMVSKSANYCYTSNSDRRGLLLLCEVALGRVKEYDNADYNADKPCLRGEADSTKGCGATIPNPGGFETIEENVVVPCGSPLNNPKTGALQYNEYIVYSTSQVKMRYLVFVNIH